jgi:hypothetical protein
MDNMMSQIMKKDRSNWTVRKVSFSEAEELDNQYYSSLSDVERLIILMELRSLIDPGKDKIEKVVFKRSLHEEEI